MTTTPNITPGTTPSNTRGSGTPDAPAADPRTLADVRAFAVGEWSSISVELRPTEDRTGAGTVEPTRLRRHFTYHDEDTFTGTITMYVDDYGTAPLLEFEFKGHLLWGSPHPIADGAFEIDYVLDDGFAVTPLTPDAAAMLNAGIAPGVEPFKTGVKNDILGRAFPMFDIAEGQVVVDYDLIYFRDGLLFMGAKHVDGTPFDAPDRRPHQLQIPIARSTD
ncbi:MAG: hypothetical protein AAGF73_03930 [Actinomycetota bacterium]